MREVAVVELEIGEDASFFIRAVGFNVGALVGSIVNETTRLVLALKRSLDELRILTICSLPD